MVVDVFPSTEVRGEACHRRGCVGAVVKLVTVGAVGAPDAPIELGAAGREFEEEDASLAADILEAAMNSERPSPWMARMGRGLRSMIASRALVARVAVALPAIVGTNQRLTTSTAVNCLSTMFGSGRTSIASS